MAFISVTYNLTNGSSGDATQVDQNFTDIINGTSDGTKSFSIAALTCAGAVTLNNSVSLGQATNNNITFLGSIAASIPVGTNTSYDFGSATLGMRSFYIGGGGTNTVRLLGPTLSATYTLTFPTSAGTNRSALITDGSGVLSFNNLTGPGSVRNYSLSTSVATNALTVTLNAGDGTAGSATNPIDIVFRSSTITSGVPVLRTVTSSPSVTIPSGTTLGTTNGTPSYIYVFGLDNAGSVELALSLTPNFSEAVLWTTAGISGGTSITTLYSTNARGSVPIRLLGRILITEATAGTWSSGATSVDIIPFEIPKFNSISSAQASDGTSNSTSFAVFSSTIQVTFTAPTTGRYKAYASLALQGNTGNNLYRVKIDASAGSPTTLMIQDVAWIQITGVGGSQASQTPFSIFYLTAGTSYTFEPYGICPASQGPITLKGSSSAVSGMYLVVEQL